MKTSQMKCLEHSSLWPLNLGPFASESRLCPWPWHSGWNLSSIFSLRKWQFLCALEKSSMPLFVFAQSSRCHFLFEMLIIWQIKCLLLSPLTSLSSSPLSPRHLFPSLQHAPQQCISALILHVFTNSSCTFHLNVAAFLQLLKADLVKNHPCL